MHENSNTSKSSKSRPPLPASNQIDRSFTRHRSVFSIRCKTPNMHSRTKSKLTSLGGGGTFSKENEGAEDSLIYAHNDELSLQRSFSRVHEGSPKPHKLIEEKHQEKRKLLQEIARLKREIKCTQKKTADVRATLERLHADSHSLNKDKYTKNTKQLLTQKQSRQLKEEIEALRSGEQERKETKERLKKEGKEAAREREAILERARKSKVETMAANKEKEKLKQKLFAFVKIR